DVDSSVPLAGMEAIFGLLRHSCGIDFTHYKPETVARRTHRRLLMNRAGGLDEYARRLADDPDELNQLYKDLLIGVTRFFRDVEAFDRIGTEVLPPLLRDVGTDEDFRLWVAGCATGEEAYSLAILVQECLDALPKPVPVKIFATDAHRASLDVAGAGFYSGTALEGVSRQRLERFFVPKDNGYQVTSDLRRMIVFAQHNLLKDAPFTKLDLITCRNLLIYFQPAAQKKVLSLFHFGLKTGGALFLGPSESPGELSDEFEAIDAHWKIYRKRRDVRLVADIRVSGWGGTSRPRPAGAAPAVALTAAPDVHLMGAYDVLLDERMPPSLLVNENRELVQSFGGASRFLRHRDGRFTPDVLELVDPELRTALAGALPRAFRERKPVAYSSLRVHLPDGDHSVHVTVRPLEGRRSSALYALVTLDEADTAALPAPAAAGTDSPSTLVLGEASRDELLSLESELRYTKENLQAMIEELETSNEELQASNEELVASNEELQSTNEELHSVNEELYTVNAEYQKKIAELTELTADMDNLLTSTEIHTIFLDRGLCIRKFTPKMAETFHLLPQDVGRRIDNFTYTIDYPPLVEDIRTVLAAGTRIERQVRDRRGHWFLLRILPYRTGLDIDGVVLTLIDIGRLKEAEADSHQKDQQLAGILRNAPSWVFIKDTRGRYLLADGAFRRVVGCDPIGKTAQEIFPAEVAELLVAQDRQVIAAGTEVEAEVVIPQADGPHTYLSVMFPTQDEAGQMTGLGGIFTDVTQLKRAESQAREAVAQRDRFLAMFSHELRNPLAAVLGAVEAASRLDPGSPEASQWLRVIERRTRHTARLVDDLLDVARLTENKIEIRRSVLDLGTTVRDVLEEVRPWFEEARLQLSQQGPSGPLPVLGDPDRLQQVQVNLLRNAAKYTPSGGRVWYSLGPEADHAVIRVRDTGVGLPATMLAKVFDPFVQANGALDRAGGGIGIGLTLVRLIVQLHGGTVEAHSDGPGKGCEFVVRLPLVAQSARTDPPDSSAVASGVSDPHTAPKRKILVVDDDDDIRAALVGILQLDGHTVRAAPDGPTALTLLEADHFDVAVVDVGIPGVDGYELARRVRSREGRAPYLIAHTGYGRPEDRAAATAAGFDAHLTKPFRPEELARLLAQCSGQRGCP
ncbi:MAG TPA: CheR family methyltransferase, partial [Isosphaeraceae bacterium]|nr:CheR family methyltransferase [Isosphaeraceae bacterium]